MSRNWYIQPYKRIIHIAIAAGCPERGGYSVLWTGSGLLRGKFRCEGIVQIGVLFLDVPQERKPYNGREVPKVPL